MSLKLFLYLDLMILQVNSILRRKIYVFNSIIVTFFVRVDFIYF